VGDVVIIKDFNIKAKIYEIPLIVGDNYTVIYLNKDGTIQPPYKLPKDWLVVPAPGFQDIFSILADH
jgi:hypothetical protein